MIYYSPVMINELLPSLGSVIRLASVVLVAGAGFAVSVEGQAFQCANATGVPPIVRAEGFAEPIADIILDCTGGIPTPPNQTIQPVNIAVNLDVNQTSKVNGVIGQVEFLESLLIVDEPNSPEYPSRPVLNCGRTEAPDNTQAGPGVCPILGGGANGAQNTYDGTPGHPNVFQGRSLGLITGQYNQVVFAGVPIDPPGTVCPNPINGLCHRIIRITNIRGDATAKGVTAPNQVSTINEQLIVNPLAGLPVDNPWLVVARGQLGRIGPTVGAGSVCVREGFNNAFKPRSLTQVLANGVAKPTYAYSGTPNAIQSITHNQNVPGAVYDTESGWTNSLDSAHGDNPINALTGGTGAGVAFSNQGGIDTGIANAGIADSGTRIALQFDIPAGASAQVPQVVQLTNVITNAVTGVMMLTNADQSGAGPFSAAAGSLNAANNIAVYEVLFANPNALEGAVIPITLLDAPPNTTLHVTTSYAPFFPPTDAVRQASATLPVPRFIDSGEALCLLGACINISPNQGANSGPLNAAIFGDPILSNAQVKLSKAGFPDILGTATTNSNPSFLSTTFDLTGAPVGPRDIVVTPQTGAPVTYHGLFSVAAPASCSYEVGGPFFEDNFSRPLVFPASGASGDLVVTPRPSTCPWEASSSVPWITLPPKSNAVTQPYIVDANPGPGARGGFGLITVAGRSIYVFQHGACTIDISPASKIFDAAGGSISVNVTAPDGCPWSAVSNASWLTVSAGASGSGNGSVTLQAAPNAGGTRSATATISNPNAEPKTFSASQGAASVCGATDVSTQVSVVRGAFLSNFLGSAYTQQVRLTNNGPTIPGPVYLVLDGLVAGSVAPTNRTTTCQSPATSYLILAAPNGLSAGQLVSLNLTFQPGLAGKGAPPTWTTTRVFSGTPSQ